MSAPRSDPQLSADAPCPRYPKLTGNSTDGFHVEFEDAVEMENLLGVQTPDAASAVFTTAIAALGESAEMYGTMASAMFAEMKPRDAVEAMLIAQMTATHVAMTRTADRMSRLPTYQMRESAERSVTRLSRTYLAQMDALKKYRAKAQQVVRVERVTVNDGGQAIVGDVTHSGGST
ncbi:hypothetical protein P2H44_10740 [Albimonas sp. CAU 1670]|uniref:hypothetical protein n=1 Tax=Albimonas sp. CAU 1670 TaxID=3032599 RepID=UPI0023D99054|nr:hypothetical protein [Albimonas sp. CAU 1670]MDF2233029.1 hypothetical protein [Albimonas sp. CAU 1670]